MAQIRAKIGAQINIPGSGAVSIESDVKAAGIIPMVIESDVGPPMVIESDVGPPMVIESDVGPPMVIESDVGPPLGMSHHGNNGNIESHDGKSGKKRPAEEWRFQCKNPEA